MKKMAAFGVVLLLVFGIQAAVLGQAEESVGGASAVSTESGAPTVGVPDVSNETSASDDAGKSLLEGVAEQPGVEGEAPKPKSPLSSWLPLIVVFIILWFFMFRGPKKRQQEHQKMLNEMSKNDRVRTIGGIYGTVVDLRDEDVIIKVDESTNTKMRVARSAISRVIRDQEETK